MITLLIVSAVIIIAAVIWCGIEISKYNQRQIMNIRVEKYTRSANSKSGKVHSG